MSRSFTYNALTLRVRPSGESNREAWFLTAEEGIVKATVFGGPKSRLRAQVAPFHEGRLWIYHDPVRDSRKVSDFDASSYRPGIRELYERAMAADALAETILASHGGGGGWPESLKLASAVLNALDSADAEASSGLAVYFLWRWAAFLGVKPELDDYSDTPFRLAPSARLWLRRIESIEPEFLAKAAIRPADASVFEQARTFSQAVLAGVLGKRLSTWDGI